MRRVSRLATALAAFVLAAVTAAFVFGGQAPAERPDNSSDFSSLPPAGSEDPVRDDLLASPWFVHTFDFASESELRGFRLSVGLFDGTVTREVAIGLANLNPSSQWSGALPFAAGPFGGLVLYGYFDGTTSALRVVSTEDGDDELVLETDDVVHQAVLDPLKDAFYYLALDPITRRELGIFRGTLQDGAVEQLVPGRASREATQIASRLFLTPDGSTLVSYDCRDDTCRLRGYVAATGELVFDVAVPASDPFGITNSEIILSGAATSAEARCREAPCPAISFDLESGLQRPLGQVCSAATVVEGSDAPILIGDAELSPACGQAPYRLVATDLGNGQVIADFTFETSARQLVVNSRDHGVGLPEGWFLLGAASQFYTLGTVAQAEGVTFVRLEDGLMVDLPTVLLGHR